MATKVFSVATMKGGSGKSTVTMLLAAALARQAGQRVLIIDTDSQRTVSQWMESEAATEPGKPLVSVEEMQPRHVQPFLKRYAGDFDIIFIDIQRVTDRDKDSPAIMLLYYCDAVLIPIIGAQMDVLSTIDFLGMVTDVQQVQQGNGFGFDFYGFINRRNRRKDNEQAETLLRANGLKMFENSLPDIKLFTSPSLFSSMLDSSEGQERFGAFFAEFCKKFKIKAHGKK